MRLCFAMVFCYPLYHIGVNNSLSVLEVIPTRVGYQSEVDHRFSSSNRWLELVLLISKEIKIIICLWVEFAYNNSYHSSISMATYETLYGRRCRSPIGWFEVGESSLFDPNLINMTLEKVDIIRIRLRTDCSKQKSYAVHRRRELEFEEGDKV